MGCIISTTFLCYIDIVLVKVEDSGYGCIRARFLYVNEMDASSK